MALRASLLSAAIAWWQCVVAQLPAVALSSLLMLFGVVQLGCTGSAPAAATSQSMTDIAELEDTSARTPDNTNGLTDNDVTWDLPDNAYCDPQTCNQVGPCAYGQCVNHVCVIKPLTGPFVCDDDPCTADRCEDGKCIATPVVGATECDGNPCTSDSCEGGSCVGLPLTTTTSCDNDGACLAASHCEAGVCIAGEPACLDGNLCSFDRCAGGQKCTFSQELGCQATGCDPPCATGQGCDLALDPPTCATATCAIELSPQAWRLTKLRLLPATETCSSSASGKLNNKWGKWSSLGPAYAVTDYSAQINHPEQILLLVPRKQGGVWSALDWLRGRIAGACGDGWACPVEVAASQWNQQSNEPWCPARVAWNELSQVSSTWSAKTNKPWTLELGGLWGVGVVPLQQGTLQAESTGAGAGAQWSGRVCGALAATTVKQIHDNLPLEVSAQYGGPAALQQLIGGLFAPDIDTDSDGVKDAVSVAWEFEAVALPVGGVVLVP